MNKQFEQAVKVYLAAPFFSDSQIQKVEKLETALANNETVASYFSPMRCQRPEGLAEEVEPFTPVWAKATMENDVKEVEAADVIVAILDYDGQDTDSGTAWELGYAIAKGKPTFLVRFEENGPGNIMLTERNTAFFTSAEQVETYDFMEAQVIPYTGKYI
ncbi:nucleoside 2-deoxyribosyltransferase [Lactococcus garvieae]|uniref:Nucleoside 2-deoxyribosyltransferase n=1 Tax=Lactococcus garvieae TaxID=1363 RepID=A0AA43PGS1_9LACT|nr:nucleoside 2-deoxyribosyltransferase [Lactococcus garvieae]MDH7960414.1 nucleoside 2-deoxyribosyltransferase [Lactococcus garvieae]BDM76688.1 nucleoside deoxyribosyltransferase [Lactococcus garvieae]BDW51955.1 nucleoside deoxyribosyltransferase [Lactococcus garvieae]